MKKKEINKNVIVKSVAKMLSDKETVRAYIKGKTSITAMNKKGIKLAKPV